MNLLAKKSVRVIENLAKAVASLEERNKVSEESLIGFLTTAQKMLSDQDEQIKNYKRDWRYLDMSIREIKDPTFNIYAKGGNVENRNKPIKKEQLQQLAKDEADISLILKQISFHSYRMTLKKRKQKVKHLLIG